MDQDSMFIPFKLDEQAAQKLIYTHSSEIKQSNVINDIKLNKEERINNAKKILISRKKGS